MINYRKLLGIKEDSPDHYQLLRIERFESDPDVISIAADRQMVYLRTLRNSDAEQLLNEVSAARVCLLNPARKAEYDRSLLGVPGDCRLDPVSLDPPPAPTSTPPPPPAPTQSGARQREREREREREVEREGQGQRKRQEELSATLEGAGGWITIIFFFVAFIAGMSSWALGFVIGAIGVVIGLSVFYVGVNTRP